MADTQSIDPELLQRLQQKPDATRGVVRREPIGKPKPWERDWSTPATESAAKPKPWEREWGAPPDDDILRRLQEADAKARQPDPDVLRRLNEAAATKASAADPSSVGAFDQAARVPDDAMKRRMGVRRNVEPVTDEEINETVRNDKQLLRQAARGATFGAAPRIEAAARTGFGLAGDYSGTLDEIREGNEAYEKENPSGAMIARIGGSLATGGAVMPVFRGAAAALAPRVGQTMANVGGATAAGTAAGATTGALESEDWTDVPGVAVDAAKGAGGGALGAAAVASPIAAAQLLRGPIAGALNGVHDAFGRVTNTGGEGWAAREREKLLANYLRGQGINVDRVTPANAGAVADNAADFVTNDMRLAISGQGAGQTTPLSYAFRDSYNNTLARALGTEGAQAGPMLNATRGIVAGQPAVTRDVVGVTTPSEAMKAQLSRGATTDMTPRYDAIGGAPVNVPTLARAIRESPNMRDLLAPSVHAAHAEGRLPANMVQQSLDMLTPGAPAVTTAGVVENMLRRAGGRINPENSATVVTDRAVQRNIERALQADVQRSPAIRDLLETRLEHANRKAAVENYERGREILNTRGNGQDEAVNAMLGVSNRDARIAGARGTRSAVADLVANAPEETVRNVANAIVPEGRRRVLAAALGRRQGSYNHQAADTIADHLEEVGRRSAHATSVQRLVEGSPAPVQGWPEQLARAAISYKMTPAAGIGRLFQGIGGLNTSRANAFIAEAARDVNAATQREYSDLARAIVMRRMASPHALWGLQTAAPIAGREAASN